MLECEATQLVLWSELGRIVLQAKQTWQMRLDPAGAVPLGDNLQYTRLALCDNEHRPLGRPLRQLGNLCRMTQAGVASPHGEHTKRLIEAVGFVNRQFDL